MTHQKTDALRKALAALGVRWTAGYWGPRDTRSDEDSVTTVWPRAGHAEGTLTFEEDEDGLHVIDEITPMQAVAMALAGGVGQ